MAGARHILLERADAARDGRGARGGGATGPGEGRRATRTYTTRPTTTGAAGRRGRDMSRTAESPRRPAKRAERGQRGSDAAEGAVQRSPCQDAQMPSPWHGAGRDGVRHRALWPGTTREEMERESREEEKRNKKRIQHRCSTSAPSQRPAARASVAGEKSETSVLLEGDGGHVPAAKHPVRAETRLALLKGCASRRSALGAWRDIRSSSHTRTHTHIYVYIYIYIVSIYLSSALWRP